MQSINNTSIHIGVFILISTFCFSCKNQKEDDAVARVYDKYLTAEELHEMMPKEVHGKDSIALCKTLIDAWIEKNVELHQAENNLSDEDKDVEQQLEDYRTSIISYKFENALANEKLDTNISNEEIEKYYNTHASDFELKDNIIKVWYLKVKKNSTQLLKLKSLIKKTDSKTKLSLEELCNGNVENYYLNDNAWLLFDELLKEIPIKTYDKEHFIQNNRFIEISDDSFVYLVNIIDFKIKDSMSPLTFESKNIRDIILNKRRLEIIENMKKDVMNEARNSNNIEVF
jgi:hypothetical protein